LIVNMVTFALIGFGELGRALAETLVGSGARVRAFSRSAGDPDRAATFRAVAEQSGADACASIVQALHEAQCVMSVVPGDVSTSVARECVQALEADALYVDLSSAPPEEKEAASELVARAGARYVDGAVLGTAAVSAGAVPILASGSGAEEWRELVVPYGLEVRAMDAPAGYAARVKLLRSVYMKGRDALIIEMLLAAHRYELTDAVLDSIGGPGEQIPFRALADRVMSGAAIHAERRAQELEASGNLVEQTGVSPLTARAAAERLRRFAALELSTVFGGERPAGAVPVLEAFEARSAERQAL
jgi:3-hydroxyisobutyrate dehydrogenase-like beta-hydroxyacid dehydrogenase